jgi:hypothetical protein
VYKKFRAADLRSRYADFRKEISARAYRLKGVPSCSNCFVRLLPMVTSMKCFRDIEVQVDEANGARRSYIGRCF